MAFDLEGRGLSPLSELLELADFPLAEFLPEEALASAFDRLSYTDAAVYDDGNNIVLDLQLVFEQELALRVPGSDAVALVFGSAGPGFTSLFGTDVGYMADADPTEEYVLMREAGLSYPRISGLAPGLDADVAVVEGNPELDIRDLARVRYTIPGGRLLYRRAG